MPKAPQQPSPSRSSQQTGRRSPRRKPRAAIAPGVPGWRLTLHTLIFEADTRAGRAFDVGLLLAIVLSVVAVMLESVAALREQYGDLLHALEWGFTILFTVEYALRLLAVGRPLRYALSFYGLVDLLAVLPTYLGLVLVGAQSLLVIRILRVLRIFRVFKLLVYLEQGELLVTALRASKYKIAVFLTVVLSVALIMGTLMYLIEGEASGFTSIPRGMYWAIVTMTTVGYGDIAPRTVLGQLAASGLMILGFAILAVPTGIVSAELLRGAQGLGASARGLGDSARGAGSMGTQVSGQACLQCAAEGHDVDARFCKLCGAALDPGAGA